MMRTLHTRVLALNAERSRRAAPSAGFTLIEIMVAIVIVGILAAVALPAYKEQVARGKRTDMQTVLLEDAQYMQRYYAANNAYNATSPAASLPWVASPRGATGAAINYTILIASSATTSYTLKAQRTSGNSMATDKCGDFTYTDLGIKGLVNQDSSQSVATCWR